MVHKEYCTWLEIVANAKKNPDHHRQHPSLDSNPGHPEYDMGVYYACHIVDVM
jgi:hypothetical protein